jgi:hypothetical protein
VQRLFLQEGRRKGREKVRMCDGIVGGYTYFVERFEEMVEVFVVYSQFAYSIHYQYRCPRFYKLVPTSKMNR